MISTIRAEKGAIEVYNRLAQKTFRQGSDHLQLMFTSWKKK